MRFLTEFFNSGTVNQQNKRRLGAMLIAVTAVLLAVALIVLMVASIVTAVKNNRVVEDEPDDSEGSGIPSGYTTTTFAEGQASNGTLLLIDAEHPYVGTESLVKIENRPLADDGTPAYSAYLDSCMLTQDALNALNAMAADFYAAKKDGWLYLIKTEYGLNLTLAYRSNKTDISIYDSANAKPVETYQWIYDNAHKYGFIQASAEEGKENVFRYVGVAHATYIVNNKMTLTAYLELVKTRTASKSLQISVKDAENKTVTYRVYYLAGDAEMVVPEKYTYTVSGDNMGGYIVTVDQSSAKK